ncbi:MAG: dihydrolipoyl dehydrogenase [Actinobacteria bacterium]|nr:dihydrolipoyl dehydrogenase [Actinomycetota bacterium]
MKTVDVAVIGAGPGGYVTAVRAAQLGFSVALIEKEKTLGGTCLNWGCIPSKALLDSSELFHQAQHQFEVHGIQVSKPKIDFKQMMTRKEDVVSSTVKGIDYLVKKNKITKISGTAQFQDANTLVVTNGKEEERVQATHIIVATGSDVASLPSVPFDGKRIISSREALELKKVPEHMIVIGGGVIGVEIGSVYARLGAKVSVVEYMPRLIPTMDEELGRQLAKSLKKLNISTYVNTKVESATVNKNKVKVLATGPQEKALELEGDYVLVAIGRRAYTDGLGLDKLGIELDQQGRIPVNDKFESSVKGVYAIGDVIQGPMLAHKASEEGVACIEYIAGQHPHYDPNLVPGVVYTWPEIASVGPSEEDLKRDGRAYKKGSFPFKASGRARASEESEGFVKVLADEKTDEILGVHMFGPRAADMISEAVVAMTYRASAEDIGMMMHAHPTFTEAIKEAALMATDKRPIHI